MAKFTDAEIEYFKTQRLGRMATVDAKGELHVVPLVFRYNAEQDTIDLGGRALVETKKYRDALKHGRIAFVVDDVLPPWKPRMVEIRGTVHPVPHGGKVFGEHFGDAMLRLTPTYIVSFGLDDKPDPAKEGTVRNRGRKVG